MANKNLSIDLRVAIDELQDELDDNYLQTWKILSSLDTNTRKLNAMLSEMNQIYHELMSSMTTTCESYSTDVYVCGAYDKEFEDHVIEWFCA